MNSETGEGKIELILGPMFSGKSTRLIELMRKYVYKAKKTIMVKFFADQRDSFDTLKQYDVIGIDEGQFFEDLVEVCEELALMGKIVLIAALNGDFRMEPFPVIQRIISKSDKIKLLKAYCFNCHKDAKFSLRIVQSNETVLIGAGEAYKPACRECHVFFSKQRENGKLDLKSIESKENKENNENLTPLKSKELKEFSSSSTLSSYSPKNEEKNENLF